MEWKTLIIGIVVVIALYAWHMYVHRFKAYCSNCQEWYYKEVLDTDAQGTYICVYCGGQCEAMIP